MIDDPTLALWREGLSLSLIAQRLAVTRGVVAGRLHRAGIKRGGAPTRMTMGGERAAPRKPPPPPEPRWITILELRPGDCRYVIETEGEDYRYCGLPVECGPWCEHHSKLVFVPPSRRSSRLFVLPPRGRR